ncbi:hypothetical protein FDUTEX481_06169 [Tolypothrix sp. PCC 7601]|nr:hypothetical protein FDUTEX481_06169 [Tolypothrix sp. PCC 7601]
MPIQNQKLELKPFHRVIGMAFHYLCTSEFLGIVFLSHVQYPKLWGAQESALTREWSFLPLSIK